MFLLFTRLSHLNIAQFYIPVMKGIAEKRFWA